MSGQSRKWMILVATIWLQAFTGTNFDFSSYSSDLKMVLGVSQVQLNYLAVASDMGKALGWSCGLAILYLPLWLVLFITAFMGLIGYGLQWLVISSVISLPYFLVFLLCLVGGCSICWFNTVCFVLCIRNFTDNRALALSLTISFSGVSAAIYTLAANSISSSSSIYLLLNAFLPLIASFAALVPILLQPPVEPLSPDEARRDSVVFLFLYVLAIFTGLYLLLLNSASSSSFMAARLLFAGALFLLALPVVIPGVVIARDWASRTIHSSFRLQGSAFNLVHVEELEQHKEMLLSQQQLDSTENGNGVARASIEKNRCCDREQLVVLGEEHSAKLLVRRLDFWLYFLAYFCGGTVGLVYSNNLGQIAQSLGSSSETLVTLYSSCSFFGRLLSASPDFLRRKVYFARTGWLAMALLPTPIAFFLLVAISNEHALQASTGLIGLSSGFIFAAAVSVTSELFGPNSFGVNHNILIANIPLGSLVYGSLAALIYDANGSSSITYNDRLFDAVVCMGRQCYRETFVWWGCISMLGLVSSVALFLRTRSVYDRFERNRMLA